MLDMKEYALEVVAFSAGRTADNAATDQMLRRAIERSMEVIGEAANRVPREVQDLFPQIPWAAIIGMRNLLAHGYDSSDPRKLWQAVTVSVPELLKHLDEAIEKQPPFEV